MKNSIVKRVKARKVQFTQHAQQRMDERDTLLDEVLDVLVNGEIVESYPDTKPLPSFLLMKFIRNQEPLYVLCGVNDEAVVITVHWFDPEKWLTPTKRK